MTDIHGFNCTDCGKCCLEGAGRLPVVERDIALWQKHAPQVLNYVKYTGPVGKRRGEMGKSNPSTRCVWIKKFPGRDHYYCRIYQWRPQVCRNYPTSRAHARLTDCPGTD